MIQQRSANIHAIMKQLKHFFCCKSVSNTNSLRLTWKLKREKKTASNSTLPIEIENQSKQTCNQNSFAINVFHFIRPHSPRSFVNKTYIRWMQGLVQFNANWFELKQKTNKKTKHWTILLTNLFAECQSVFYAICLCVWSSICFYDVAVSMCLCLGWHR